MAPYRHAPPAREEPGPEPHYVPLTRRQQRLRRWLRLVPVILLALAGLYFAKFWLYCVAVICGLAVIVSEGLYARSLNARLKAVAGTMTRDVDPSVMRRALEAIVADARPYPGFHSVALVFLAIARARIGDVDGALELLYAVHRGGWLARRTVWEAWLLPWLSQLHLARGEVDLGAQWLEVARKALPESKHQVLVAPETLLALRQGRWEDAIARIEGYVGTHTPTDTARAHYGLLRAFACERAGRPLPEDEARAIVAARLQLGGRALPIEKVWADLAAFVEKHSPPEA